MGTKPSTNAYSSTMIWYLRAGPAGECTVFMEFVFCHHDAGIQADFISILENQNHIVDIFDIFQLQVWLALCCFFWGTQFFQPCAYQLDEPCRICFIELGKKKQKHVFFSSCTVVQWLFVGSKWDANPVPPWRFFRSLIPRNFRRSSRVSPILRRLATSSSIRIA